MVRMKSRARKNVQSLGKKVRRAPSLSAEADPPRRSPAFKRPASSDKAAPMVGPRVNRSAQRALRTHRRRPGAAALQ